MEEMGIERAEAVETMGIAREPQQEMETHFSSLEMAMALAHFRRRGIARAETNFRGVTERPLGRGRFVAQIRDPRKNRSVWLGSFKTAEKAARAYDIAALELYGPNAKTNFSIDDENNSIFSANEADPDFAALDHAAALARVADRAFAADSAAAYRVHNAAAALAHADAALADNVITADDVRAAAALRAATASAALRVIVDDFCNAVASFGDTVVSAASASASANADVMERKE